MFFTFELKSVYSFVHVLFRFHCLRLFVSVLVLKCSSATERARMINVWIQTAIQLQSPSFGDLYAFSAIMHALLGAPVNFDEFVNACDKPYCRRVI